MSDADRLAELRRRYYDLVEARFTGFWAVKEMRDLAREMQTLRHRMKKEESEEPETVGSAVPG